MNIKRILLFILIMTLLACNTKEISNKVYDKVDWNYEALETVTPESQGIDSRHLLELLDEIEQNDKYQIDGITIVRNGYKIFDIYKSPFTKDSLHDIYSSTKSITSLLIGIAIDKGFIKSVDDLIIDYLPEHKFENTDKQWEEITIKHLLTMTAGITDDDISGSFLDMLYTEDWLGYILGLEFISDDPGKQFLYSNLSSYLLAEILFYSTKKEPVDFASEYLFKPLGITKYSWYYESHEGVQPGCSFINLRTEDFAKIGLLVLQKGEWNSEEIVSSKWISESTKPHVNRNMTKDVVEYGYQWWILDEDTFLASGSLCQQLLISPKYNMVVAINGGQSDLDWQLHRNISDIFSTRLNEKISTEALEENTDTYNELHKRKIEWSTDIIDKVKGINSNFPFTKSTYILSDNPLELERIEFEWDGDKGSIKTYNVYGEPPESILLDKSYYNKYPDYEGQTQESRVFMRDNKVLDVYIKELPEGWSFNYEITFYEDEKKIKVKVYSSSSFSDSSDFIFYGDLSNAAKSE